MRSTFQTLSALALVVFFSTLSLLCADEGLWPFGELPRQQIKETHGFEITDSWLDHLQKSTVDVNSGGSGVLVSPQGLLLTNHHVALRSLLYLTDTKPKLIPDGFQAKNFAEEIRCPGLEVRVLWDTTDVTRRVHDAIKPDLSLTNSRKARQSVCRTIENESQEKTGLESRVECLGEGERYILGRYRNYTDVRLVLAPEEAISDVHDFCFFRAYEDGKPAAVKHYLQWADAGLQPNDSIFVAGYPRRTTRFLTAAHLKFLTDAPLFLRFKLTGRLEKALAGYPNNPRAAQERILMERERTRNWNLWNKLHAALAQRRTAEKSFRALLAKKPGQEKAFSKAHEHIALSIQEWDRLHRAKFFLADGAAFPSTLFYYARMLIRLVDENTKSDGGPGYFSVARRNEWKRWLLAPKPIDKDIEEVKLAVGLDLLVEYQETDRTFLAVLAGKTPDQRARSLVRGSRLDDATVRKKILEGGKKALAESQDPMIVFARLVEDYSQQIANNFSDKVVERWRIAYPVLARARLEMQGKKGYADANGSLRLSFGRVQKARSQNLSIWTLGDFFQKQEFSLPPRWTAARHNLDQSALALFASSADAAPGSSGSPVVNRAGHLVGIVFARTGDPPTSLAHTHGKSHTFMVAAAGIRQVLEKVCDADNLVKELGGRACQKK